MKELLEAKKAGKIRFIGFTGHKDPRIHLYMLEVAKENGFKFDSVQRALNVMDAAIQYALNTPTSVVIAKTAQAVAKGKYEPLKTSSTYDGTATSAEWLGEEPDYLKAIMEQ